jgi:putative sterol carrier protein
MPSGKITLPLEFLEPQFRGGGFWMFLLADEHSRFDKTLWDSVAVKLKKGGLAKTDIPDCFKLFCFACNGIDELRFELNDFTASYQFDFDGERFALAFKSGACSVYSGDLDLPDITMWMKPEIARDLIMGKANSGAAHMNGDIQYKGTKNSAVKLQSIFELFLDELDV